ncbi:MAG: DUF481 domain-containing protein, partial [Bacteroides sp.]|nr:DUF481 domain-containing protein [Bacteroides sp.]
MRRNNQHWIVVISLLLMSQGLAAQTDSVLFESGEFVIGEIKSMDRGVLKIETDYSDSDFLIEWSKVSSIHTTTRFMITHTNGSKYYGYVHSLNDSTFLILDYGGKQVESRKMDIVALSPFDDKFLDRLNASISLGFDLAKAQNLTSLSTRSFVGYTAQKWSTDIAFSTVRSNQDSVDEIQRTEGEWNLRYILPRRFYAIATVSGLSNTEQKLDLRMNMQLGVGNFLVRTNYMYWGAKMGFNRNYENYSNEEDERQSWEGYLGTELNLFDMGDLDLYFLFMAYPGLTELGRIRTDSKLDVKYELPLDFFINLG